MKTRRTLITTLGMILVTACDPALSNVMVLTFDDFPTGGCEVEIPDGYGGFDWDNFRVYDVDRCLSGTQSGYFNGRVSGDYVAYNSSGGQAMLSDDPFDFIGAYLTAAWRRGLTIQITGSLDNVVLYEAEVVVDYTEPTWFDFNFVGIDMLTLRSYGGVDVLMPEGRGPHFVMDDFTYIPEPATLLLLGLGGLALLRRRRQL